jgi:hypothetical protein
VLPGWAQETYRRLYASETKRLELFATYFSLNPCLLPELSAWLAAHAAPTEQACRSRG